MKRIEKERESEYARERKGRIRKKRKNRKKI